MKIKHRACFTKKRKSAELKKQDKINRTKRHWRSIIGETNVTTS